MSNERWLFAKAILENPLEATYRLVFADWLDEQGCKHAAKRQREYAKHITNALILRKVEQGYILYFSLKNNLVKALVIRLDGEIHIYKTNYAIGMLNVLITVYKTGKINNYIKQQLVWIKESLLNVREVAK